ncbi:MAG: hypothetical protein WCF90_04280 [Methanomicrobiales archaeon]
MSDSDHTIVYIIGFFIGFIIRVTGFWRYLVVQKLINTLLSNVISTSVGRVALSGKARLRDAHISPVSVVPCAFWRICVSY